MMSWMATSHTAARDATLRMATSLEPAGPAVTDDTPAADITTSTELLMKRSRGDLPDDNKETDLSLFGCLI